MKGTSKFFTFGLVTSWYSSNIGVLLLNKYLLSNYRFKYPIFLTMCHMTACSLLSYVAIVWMKMVPMQTIRSRVQSFKIADLSLVFCISIVFGNISIRFLPVSFNQAIGATTPFFTAVFAYLMTLKREAWLVYVTLIPVVTGVVIASGDVCLSSERVSLEFYHAARDTLLLYEAIIPVKYRSGFPNSVKERAVFADIAPRYQLFAEEILQRQIQLVIYNLREAIETNWKLAVKLDVLVVGKPWSETQINLTGFVPLVPTIILRQESLNLVEN